MRLNISIGRALTILKTLRYIFYRFFFFISILRECPYYYVNKRPSWFLDGRRRATTPHCGSVVFVEEKQIRFVRFSLDESRPFDYIIIYNI